MSGFQPAGGSVTLARMTPATRDQICASTAAKLTDAAERIPTLKAVVGLDGFVDEIIAVVDKRQGDEAYLPVRTIARLAEKIGAAAGQSSNYELVVKQMKLGGNGPIMADALAAAGAAVTYLGSLGYPDLHPVFKAFAERATVVSFGQPAHTDALEFEDGKLMLGKLEPLNEVNWDNLINRVGRDALRNLLGGADLIGMVNWTMLPHMSRIWAKLLDEVVPNFARHDRKLFVDLADPEKRTSDDIMDALNLLRRFQDQVDVILGLNLKESATIADVLGLPGRADPEAHIEAHAAAIRAELGVSCVCVHPRRGAAAATATESARFNGPFVQQPKISTGAGDHFNAGFCLGRVLGLGLAESLCVGVGTSGYYVRSAQSPTSAELAAFIAELPPPQA